MARSHKLSTLCITLFCAFFSTHCANFPQRHIEPIQSTISDQTTHSSQDIFKAAEPKKDMQLRSFTPLYSAPMYLEQQLGHYNGVSITHRGDIIHIVISADTLFAPDSTELKANSLTFMKDLTQLIAIYRPKPLYVTGYTDSVNTKRYNQSLAYKQAQAVLGYIWAEGVNENWLHAVGYGEQPTVATNRTVNGSRMNRRIELLFWDNHTRVPFA